MKKIILALAGTVLLSTQIMAAPKDYSTALSRHAQSAVREVVTQWISLRTEGKTWNAILRDAIPATLDSQCGYRSQIGLSDTSFKRARSEVEPVVGMRLEKAFGTLLSRPGAQLNLQSTRVLPNTQADQVLVTLKVTPEKPKDPTLSILMELSGGGEMVMCDLSPEADPRKGVLYTLGNDLNL